MSISELSFFNVYQLVITQNTDNIFTISNRAGETFIADFKEPERITLRHFNCKYEHGRTHRQGEFRNVQAMLNDVNSHGNRLFKLIKPSRMDMLFAQIERR